MAQSHVAIWYKAALSIAPDEILPLVRCVLLLYDSSPASNKYLKLRSYDDLFARGPQ